MADSKNINFTNSLEEDLDKVLSWTESESHPESLAFQNNISSIYDYSFTPAIKNLYTVTILTEDSNLNHYLECHATKVSFGEETLSLERNKVTKTFQLISSGGYNLQDDLKITWREADDWRVKKYHEDWLACFYDKVNDTYRSYDKEDDTKVLYRTIYITLPESKSENAFTNTSRMRRIRFTGVFPTNTGSFDFEWGSSGGIISHQMTYKVKDWCWVGDEDTVAVVGEDGKEPESTSETSSGGDGGSGGSSSTRVLDRKS